MPIYSRNRTGFMETAQTPADTSYGVNDFGRALYETQQNDMAFFESILAADFNEIKGLNEGTILESEVAALNEASFNAIIQKLIERLKKKWESIKGFFKNAIDNIATYVSTKASELSGKFSSMVGNKIKNWDGSITIRTFDHTHKVFQYDIDIINDLIEADVNHNNDKNYSSAEICSACLHSNIAEGDGTMSVVEFTKAAMEACSSETTFNKSNINELKAGLTNGRAHIKSLREKEKQAGKVIGATIKRLEGMMNSEKNVAHLNNVVSGYEAYITIVTRAGISAVRNDMKSKAAGLAKVIAAVAKTPKELKEAYILEAAEDFDTIMNGEFNQGLIDDEARANIENLLKAAEE